MHIVDDIPAGPKVPDLVNVVVEIPRGSQNKYEFDKKSGLLMLDRVLFSAVHYPADYGIIPQTLADDGDALDALVLVSNPTYPGTLVAARPLGMLTMIQKCITYVRKTRDAADTDAPCRPGSGPGG